MALIVLLNKISEALDNGEYVIGVFLYFSKAFNAVSHSILLKKAELYGICDTPLKRFKYSLANRIQYVIYNNIKSLYSVQQCSATGIHLRSIAVFNLH